MSMMTMTTEAAPRQAKVREPGFFDRLMSAIRVARAVENGLRPARTDLETLGIAGSFENYLARRHASRA